MNYQDAITIKAGHRGGQPCVRGMRIAVSDVLDWLAAGMSHDDIRAEYPELTEMTSAPASPTRQIASGG